MFSIKTFSITKFVKDNWVNQRSFINKRKYFVFMKRVTFLTWRALWFVLTLLVLTLVLLTSCVKTAPADAATVKFGVLSDIHLNDDEGKLKNLKNIVNQFEKQNVDAIIVAGDSVLNEHLRDGVEDTVIDADEMKAVLDILSSANKKVYIIPGNHETKESYSDVIEGWKKTGKNKKNNADMLLDMSIERYIDLDNVDIVSLSGYYVYTLDNEFGKFQFVPENGFFADNDSILSIEDYANKLDDTILLISHGPPKGFGKYAIDYANNGQNVGSDLLLEVMRESGIRFGVFGHIHEAYGATDIEGNQIQQGMWVDELLLNPGSVADGRAAILEFKGDRARYEMLFVR